MQPCLMLINVGARHGSLQCLSNSQSPKKTKDTMLFVYSCTLAGCSPWISGTQAVHRWHRLATALNSAQAQTPQTPTKQAQCCSTCSLHTWPHTHTPGAATACAVRTCPKMRGTCQSLLLLLTSTLLLLLLLTTQPLSRSLPPSPSRALVLPLSTRPAL